MIGTFKEGVETFGQTEVTQDTLLIPYTVSRYFTENGSTVFFVNTQMLDGIAENQRIHRLTRELQKRMSNRRLRVSRVEPILDSEGELQGYMAFARQ